MPCHHLRPSLRPERSLSVYASPHVCQVYFSEVLSIRDVTEQLWNFMIGETLVNGGFHEIADDERILTWSWISFICRIFIIIDERSLYHYLPSRLYLEPALFAP